MSSLYFAHKHAPSDSWQSRATLKITLGFRSRMLNKETTAMLVFCSLERMKIPLACPELLWMLEMAFDKT